ncbi:hypothetical protein [Mycolicibacterium gadium]|jgi:hypothetical protein|uniref:hypothetical protein n=1 Tax=Mycolicibacterium gadium TaxID=1794 RepID=UPI002FDDD3AD
MSTSGLTALRLAAGAAACSTLAIVGLGPATAAPTADGQGYIDSTARCPSSSQAVVFGSTATSRVAICEADGAYEYRGVRLSDGAKLIVPAVKSTDGYTAENHGITYWVTEDSLVVSAGNEVIRDETMVDFNSPQQSGVGGSPAPVETSTPTTPLPPPLPAEVGGGES